MKLITFNPFRTLGMTGVSYVKPDHMFKDIHLIREADMLLFPEKWQVNSLVYGLNKKIFPSIQSIQLGFDKVEMTRAFWSLSPDLMPYTEIAGRSNESIERILNTFPFPFVAKEVRSSMGNGVFLIRTEEDFRSYAERNEVLYVQEYLPIEKDLRVVYVGNKVVSAYWRVGGESFLNNVAQGGKLSFHNIPEEALQLVDQTAKALGINHAGFDVVYSNGKYYFLEFNCLFRNQALIQQGIQVEKLIYTYIQEQFPPLVPPTPFKQIS
ncbi:ATP-grasp domain-containing protein [Guptibacillus spartinae]|uniref:ATP-grasp domain-containing protein n=1 Tax=Guptibacillus spartinae TaxID=3025679 RepID=UPI002360D88C|nr:ATP-grasp domain-containing protein [Pseudalkalibacillus spartinae]